MLQVSTGFSQALLGGKAFAELFASGAIAIYANDHPRPTSANAPVAATMIGMVTNQGLPWAPVSNTAYGLQFEEVGRYVRGNSSQAWQLTPFPGADLFTASFWRLMSANENFLASDTLPRIDGDIGLISAPAGQEFLWSSLVLSPGLAIPFNNFYYTIPAND